MDANNIIIFITKILILIIILLLNRYLIPSYLKGAEEETVRLKQKPKGVKGQSREGSSALSSNE
jgi:hypothetical protein